MSTYRWCVASWKCPARPLRFPQRMKHGIFGHGIPKFQTHMVISWVIGVPPSHHPFLDGIFPHKPSIWGYPMTMETPTWEGRGETLRFGSPSLERIEGTAYFGWTYAHPPWQLVSRSLWRICYCEKKGVAGARQEVQTSDWNVMLIVQGKTGCCTSWC